jgi:hypothetical protein
MTLPCHNTFARKYITAMCNMSGLGNLMNETNAGHACPLQEVHEAVAARLVELEGAMNAELSALAGAGQAQLAALQHTLGDKMGGIAALKAQFEVQLNAAWEDYGETYGQLAAVQEVGHAYEQSVESLC